MLLGYTVTQKSVLAQEGSVLFSSGL